MEERRRISRVEYDAKGVIVVCKNQKKIYVDVKNISPLGIAAQVPADCPSLLGDDVIIVADTLIMYADVIREDENPDGTKLVALDARKFTGEVLEYLFTHIAVEE